MKQKSRQCYVNEWGMSNLEIQREDIKLATEMMKIFICHSIVFFYFYKDAGRIYWDFII